MYMLRFVHQTITFSSLLHETPSITSSSEDTETGHTPFRPPFIQGRPTLENTWFPGYRWQISYCPSCYEHLGWKFTAVKF